MKNGNREQRNDDKRHLNRERNDAICQVTGILHFAYFIAYLLRMLFFGNARKTYENALSDLMVDYQSIQNETKWTRLSCYSMFCIRYCFLLIAVFATMLKPLPGFKQGK